MLVQAEVDGKPDEIRALLNLTDRREAIAADAMRAQCAAAETITGKGGHFAMVLKGSRKTPRKDVRYWMEYPAAA